MFCKAEIQMTLQQVDSSDFHSGLREALAADQVYGEEGCKPDLPLLAAFAHTCIFVNSLLSATSKK